MVVCVCVCFRECAHIFNVCIYENCMCTLLDTTCFRENMYTFLMCVCMRTVLYSPGYYMASSSMLPCLGCPCKHPLSILQQEVQSAFLTSLDSLPGHYQNIAVASLVPRIPKAKPLPPHKPVLPCSLIPTHREARPTQAPHWAWNELLRRLTGTPASQNPESRSEP